MKEVYLITGGTGTLGTALTRHLIGKGHHVRAFARNEHRHLALERALPEAQRGLLSSLIGDVRDRRRLLRAMHEVDIVIHAAAMKIVPSCEYNPIEAVKTNIVGTANVIDAAIDCGGVRKAMFVSTDKAVSPHNLYGATKMVAERLWINANVYTGGNGIFSAVRYGNVFDSAGSVLHSFLEQRDKQGVLNITDNAMTRFHIRIDQAVDFVLRAVDQAVPGEIWIPKLPSYRIGDLAEAVAPGVPVEVTIRRSGEKLSEDLISQHESFYTADHGDHFRISSGHPADAGNEKEYNSLSNPWRLTKKELQQEVAWARRLS